MHAPGSAVVGSIDAALAIGGAAIRLAGRAINPVSGRPQVMIVSEARERELGEDEAKRVAETMGRVTDPALTPYVGVVGARLAALSPRVDVPIGPCDIHVIALFVNVMSPSRRTASGGGGGGRAALTARGALTILREVTVACRRKLRAGGYRRS